MFIAKGAYNRYSMSDYISERFKSIDGVILDELHQFKGDSGQGDAMETLVGCSKKVIGMTATLINGYSSGLFYLLYRIVPHLMKIDNKDYDNPGAFNGEYGPYSMNVTNTQTIDSLEDYKILTISPELSKKDYEDIAASCKYPNRIELLVQGSVELMKSRYHLLYGSELERNYKNYLIDRKNNRYPIHKSISGEEIIIFNDSELSLLEEINHLKNLGYCNFSIDGRYKDNDYYKMVEVYKSALNGNINKKELLKYSPKNTLGNY